MKKNKSITNIIFFGVHCAFRKLNRKAIGKVLSSKETLLQASLLSALDNASPSCQVEIAHFIDTYVQQGRGYDKLVTLIQNNLEDHQAMAKILARMTQP